MSQLATAIRYVIRAITGHGAAPASISAESVVKPVDRGPVSTIDTTQAVPAVPDFASSVGASISGGAGVTTIYVDPTAASGGNGSLSTPYASWSQVSFKAGYSYLQKAGTTSESGIYVGASGTSSGNIVIGAYGTGPAPIVLGSVNLDGASYVQVSGLTVSAGAAGGIVMQNGAHNDTVSNNTVADSTIGIWIGSGSGSNTLVQNNQILQSSTDGIAIDGTVNTSTTQTQILNNKVMQTGSHGIEVEANYVTVNGNTVWQSGLTIAGSSGIHVYASSTNGLGAYDTIKGNVVVGSVDTASNDGNGIELDQFTHNNTVSDNFTYNNSGAGIALYDSYDNTVTGNFAAADELDPGHTHTRKAELLLNESQNFTYGNTISDNTLLSAFAAVPAVYGDSNVASGANIFSGNVLESLAHDLLFAWGLKTGTSQSQWQQYAPTDKTSGIPMFAADTLSGSYGYSFAGSPTVSLDGHNVQLVGWSSAQGLGVNYLS